MITDDEVMRVLEQANPASVDDPIPMLDAAGYRDLLDARNTTMTLIDNEPTTSEPSSGRRWPILIAAAAAVILVIARRATRDDDAAPADQPSPTATVPPTTPPRPLPKGSGGIALGDGARTGDVLRRRGRRDTDAADLRHPRRRVAQPLHHRVASRQG